MAHKTIGILGGMSPESSIEYYRYITREYTRRFGDYSYPPIVLYSVNFQPYVDWPKSDRWDLVAQGLIAASEKLAAAGADFIVIATNTMHLVVDEIRSGVSIPVLSLLDVVADAIQAKGLHTVGLLGTRFTMEKDFYRDALTRRGIDVLTPDPIDRAEVNRVIYEELVAGRILAESRTRYIEIIRKLQKRGCQGVILGCTEIPLLITAHDVDLPLLDTTLIHAEAALNMAIQE